MASVKARVSGQGQGDHAGRIVAHPLVADGARARGRLAALESEQLLEAALFDLAGVRVRARSEAALVDLPRRQAVWRLACRFGFGFGSCVEVMSRRFAIGVPGNTRELAWGGKESAGRAVVGLEAASL